MRSDDALNTKFQTTRYSAGYDQREVDEFLDRAAASLDALERGDALSGALTAADVRSARFTCTRILTGYAQRDVDDFLDRLEAALAGHERELVGV